MSSTSTWLQSKEWADLAFVLVFEGVDLAITTTDDVSGIEGSLASTDWTAVYSGLNFGGGREGDATVESSIQLFDGSIEIPDLNFTLVDYDDVLATNLFAASKSSGKRAFLTGSITSSATTIAVKPQSAFDSSGTAYCGLEAFDYSGVTTSGGLTASFTGCTRGKWALYGTSSDATHFGLPHRADVDSSFMPEVTSWPALWYNRGVKLYAVHRVNGAWAAIEDAFVVYAGRIKSWRDEGNGRVVLETRSILESLKTSIFSEQYRGSLREGMYLSTSMCEYVLASKLVQNGSSPTTKPNATEVFAAAGYKTAEEVRSAISQTLQVHQTDTFAAAHLSVSKASDGAYAGDRVIFHANVSGAASTDHFTFQIALHPRIWTLLGWPDHDEGEGRTHTASGYPAIWRTLQRDTDEDWSLAAPQLPLRYCFNVPTPGTTGSDFSRITIATDSSRGTYYAQPSTTIPTWAKSGSVALSSIATGFLRIGDAGLYAARSDGAGGFYLLAEVSKLLSGFGAPSGATPNALMFSATYDEPSVDVEVSQVWIEQDEIGKIMLRLLASTGTNSYTSASAYNDSTYDTLPPGFGAGIPWTTLDTTSILGMGTDQYLLIVEKAEPLIERLESALAFCFSHAVFADGVITVVPAGSDAPAGLAEASFTENNKATPDDFPAVTMSTAGIVNRAVLKYHRNLGGTYVYTVQAENLPSQTNYRQIKTANVEAMGVYEGLSSPYQSPAKAWFTRAGQALGYYANPVAVIERTYDFSLESVFWPGSRVAITDNRIIDPRTGARGVTSLPCWVLGKSFNWATGIGRVRLAFMPTLDTSRLALWAPSARVDDTVSSGGFTNGYNAGTKTLRCKAHEYSLSSESADASYFGGKVHVYRLGQTSPTSWTDTVVSQSGNDIVLATGLAGWTGTGIYVVEYDDILTDIASQYSGANASAFLADDANNSTGKATNDAYVWQGNSPWKGDTATTTQVYRKIDSAADDAGEPLSVHKFADVANSLHNALSYRTQWSWSDVLLSTAYRTHNTSATNKLVYGPVYVPLPGGARDIRAEVLGFTDKGTCTFRIYLSTGMPTGSSVTATTYPDSGATYIDAVTTSTSLCWTSATTATDPVSPVRVFGGGDFPMPGLWLTVEIVLSGGATLGTFAGIALAEAAL